MPVTVADRKWEVYRFRLGGFCKHLRIAYPPGQEQWRQWAVEYWNGWDKETQRSGMTRIRLDAPRDGAPVYFFKRFLVRNRRDGIKHFIRRSRARRALDASAGLLARGFSAPAHVCIIELVRCGFVCQSALVSEDLSHTRPVLDALRDDTFTDAARRRLVVRTAGEIARLHRAGIYHGDLRMGNIFYTQTSDKFNFCFIDNERTRIYGRLPLGRRICNLVQVNMTRWSVTTTDRLRFWRAYLQHSDLSGEQARRVFDRTMKKTTKRWKHKDWLAEG